MAQLSFERRRWFPAFALPVVVMGTLLLGVRLVSRFRKTGGTLGLDDAFITLGWGLAIISTSLAIYGTQRLGWDRHVWAVEPSLWEPGVKVGWYISLIYLWATSFTKVSVLLFYRRLVAGTYSRRFKWLLWGAIGFIIAYSITLSALLLTTCFPLNAYWRQIDPYYGRKFRCASIPVQSKVAQFGGALSVITDFYSVLLPALLLFRIRISNHQRWGLIGIFGLGFLVVIAGSVRTAYLSEVSGSTDKTWLAFNIMAAGIAEQNLAIVCACAPSIRAIFRTYFKNPTTIGSSRGSHAMGSLPTATSGSDAKAGRQSEVISTSVDEIDSLEADHGDHIHQQRTNRSASSGRGSDEEILYPKDGNKTSWLG